MGARVVKVQDPNLVSNPDLEFSEGFGRSSLDAFFKILDAGKESIVLSLANSEKSTQDRLTFEAMLARADILVEDLPAGKLEDMGYSWQKLHAVFPTLVVASISPFGQSGPYKDQKAHDTTIQGMGGLLTSTGLPDLAVKAGPALAEQLAAVYCATGVGIALKARHHHRKGSYLDVSMLDCLFSFHGREFVGYQLRGSEPPRLGNVSPVGYYPFDVFECLGGERFAVCCMRQPHFVTFCDAIDAPELANDDRFSTPELRWAHWQDLAPKINVQTRKLDRKSLVDKLLSLPSADSFPVGPVNTFGDLARDPQLRARRMLTRSRSSQLLGLGSAIKISKNPTESDAFAAKIEEVDLVPDAPTEDEQGPRLRQEFSAARMSKL